MLMAAADVAAVALFTWRWLFLIAHYQLSSRQEPMKTYCLSCCNAMSSSDIGLFSLASKDKCIDDCN